MARQIINTGTTGNDGTGDDLRTGATKINDNFSELYGDAAALQVSVGSAGGLDGISFDNKQIVFEGITDDSSETTLTTVDPTADRTISLPNVSGTLPVLAAASTTQITATPEELNILDGVSGVSTAEINFLDGVTSSIQTQLNTALTSTTGATKAFAIAQAVALG